MAKNGATVDVWEDGGTATVLHGTGSDALTLARKLLKTAGKTNEDPTSIMLNVIYVEQALFDGSVVVTP